MTRFSVQFPIKIHIQVAVTYQIIMLHIMQVKNTNVHLRFYCTNIFVVCQYIGLVILKYIYENI